MAERAERVERFPFSALSAVSAFSASKLRQHLERGLFVTPIARHPLGSCYKKLAGLTWFHLTEMLVDHHGIHARQRVSNGHHTGFTLGW